MTQPPPVANKSHAGLFILLGAVVAVVVIVAVCIFGLVLLGESRHAAADSAAAAEAAKPTVPVSVTYRNSAVGKGYVAQFHNTSNKFMKILVTFNNKTLNTTKTGSLDLPAFGMVEIGWQQGWEFVSGETIEVSEADYRTMVFTIR